MESAPFKFCFQKEFVALIATHSALYSISHSEKLEIKTDIST